MDTQKLLEFIISLYTLKRLPRIGWIIAGVPKSSVESIADHSYFVALLAYILSFFIDGIDKEKLIKLALIHDLSEAIVHDIGGEARKLIPRGIRKRAELEGLERIIPKEFSELRWELVGLWREYEKGISKEAQIVRALDKLDMFIQALIYREITCIKEGLKDFFDSIQEMTGRKEEILREIFREIEKKIYHD